MGLLTIDKCMCGVPAAVGLQAESNVCFEGLQQLQGLQELEFEDVDAADPSMWGVLAQMTQLTGKQQTRLCMTNQKCLQLGTAQRPQVL